MTKIDAWMARSPWHPRLAPFFVYMLFLPVLLYVVDVTPYAYAPIYVLQCGVTLWLLWRYRKLVPELTLRFHWTVIPSAVLLLVAWVGLGWLSAGQWGERVGALQDGQLLGALDGESPDHFMFKLSGAWFVAAVGLRLLGMSIVVPLFEELFTRSALLRGLAHPKQTVDGIVQVLCDLPLVGDGLINTSMGRRVTAMPSQLTKQLTQTGLGQVTIFGTIMSTLVFMANHIPRDYLGCVACGVVWCAMVRWTNRPSLPEEKRKGLGPVIWSHGLVNALLWAYTVHTGDWQFM